MVASNQDHVCCIKKKHEKDSYLFSDEELDFKHRLDMGFLLEHEELRNIRENQERAEFESWQRRNPEEASRLYEENQEWLSLQLKKQKEDHENRERIAQESSEILTAFALAVLNPLLDIVLPLAFVLGLFYAIIYAITQILRITPVIVILAIGALAFTSFILFLIHLLMPRARRRRIIVHKKRTRKH